MSLHPLATEGFGRDAPTYARSRPDFPPQALEWLRQDLGLESGKVVVEIGAGTGKFTQLLAQTGASIVAADPVEAMLARLAADMPEVHTVLASAQHLPLAERAADVVVCAQSFHWFATPAALGEIHRVLKPGGMLGLVWNVRDRSVPWVNALSRLIDRHEGDAPRYDQAEWRAVFPAPGFGEMREKAVAHAHVGDAEQVIVARTASVSFVAALPDIERRALLDEVRALIAVHPDLAGQSTVSMPYVTRMYWCRALV